MSLHRFQIQDESKQALAEAFNCIMRTALGGTDKQVLPLSVSVENVFEDKYTCLLYLVTIDREGGSEFLYVSGGFRGDYRVESARNICLHFQQFVDKFNERIPKEIKDIVINHLDDAQKRETGKKEYLSRLRHSQEEKKQ